MTTFPIQDATRITLHRVLLRQHAASGNSVARCRARLTEALQNLTPPSAMPPQAILIIRRLADPSPGLLLTNQPTHSWGKGAEAQIAATWQRAIRAAHTPVPPSADAVWFADPAEWLACLSWELHRGTAMQQWWWQSWLSKNDLSQAVRLFRHWQQEAQSLPQALAHLHAKQGAAIGALLQHLSTDQAQAIIQEIEAAYALPAPPSNAPTLSPPPAATRLVATLPAAHGTLLALCLGLVQTPLAVQRHYRPPTFAPIPAPPPSDPPPTPPTPTRGQGSKDAPLERNVIPRSLRRGIPPPTIRRKPHPIPPQLGEGTGSPLLKQLRLPVIARSLRRRTPPPAAPTKPQPNSPQARPTRVGEETAFAERKLIFLPPTKQKTISAQHEITAPSPSSLERGSDPALPIATRFGGLWLLVNPLEQLQWLEEKGQPLNGWHKIAALAHTLIPDLASDPIAPLLATQTEEIASPAAVSAWIAYALPHVHRFLAARLEETQEFFAALHDPAHMHITPTHIDVVFDIEHIRLPLRLAGLDQNPGWTPQLGRVVTLHYV